MKAQIERGTALVLCGPQGCGKGRLAQKLASKTGSFVEVVVEEVENRKIFKRVLDAAFDTVIVNGFPRDRATLVHLKALITEGTHQRIRPGRPAEVVKAPNFVFCTGDAEPLKAVEGRRFHVVDMGGQA